MRKNVLLSAIVISALCLCGCNMQLPFGDNGGGNGQINASEDVKDDVQTSDSSQEQSGDSGEQAGLEEVQTTSGFLKASSGELYDYCYEDVMLMQATCGILKVDAPEYPALEEAVEQYNATYEEAWRAETEELRTWAREDYAYSVSDGTPFYGPYTNEDTLYITRADALALSAVAMNYWYSGGAHGSTGFRAVNFDTKTGRQLELTDVIADTEALPGILTTELLEQYPHMAESLWDTTWDEFFASYLTPPTTDDITPEFTWTVGYEGVTFYFGAYEIGAYADGTQAVVVTYNEYPELFNALYFTENDTNYVVEVAPFWWGEEGFTDINDDGVMDMIIVDGIYSEDMEHFESISIMVNNVTYTHEAIAFELNTYLVKADGDTYLYVKRTLGSDYECVSVFRITESSVTYIGDFDGYLSDFTNSKDFGLNKRFDLLSTLFGEARCYIGDMGMPIEKEGVYQIKDVDTTLTSTVEITAEVVNEQGDLLGESKTYPAGTEFTFRSSDGKTYVDMETNEGSRCRFYVTSVWPPTVNGMDAENSFEMLYYFG